MKVWISGGQGGKHRAFGRAVVMTIKINEIFYSIQGESSWVGQPTVFVRTSGCHLRCTYCDTTYAYHEGEVLSVEAVVAKVRAFPTKYVCVTGGEPLLQSGVYPLMTQLCDLGYQVSLETSGDKSCAHVDPRVKKIIDVKTPDSGEPHRFDRVNLRFNDAMTEFKFVIGTERDFEWAEQFARENNLFEKSNVLYSPSFKIVEPAWLAQKILGSSSKARLQLQMHKIIWPAIDRGV